MAGLPDTVILGRAPRTSAAGDLRVRPEDDAAALRSKEETA
jgi:hypothetical protein